MDRGNTLTGNQYVVQVSVCGRRPLFNFEVVRDDLHRPVFFSLNDCKIVFPPVSIDDIGAGDVPAFFPEILSYVILSMFELHDFLFFQ